MEPEVRDRAGITTACRVARMVTVDSQYGLNCWPLSTPSVPCRSENVVTRRILIRRLSCHVFSHEDPRVFWIEQGGGARNISKSLIISFGLM